MKAGTARRLKRVVFVYIIGYGMTVLRVLSLFAAECTQVESVSFTDIYTGQSCFCVGFIETCTYTEEEKRALFLTDKPSLKSPPMFQWLSRVEDKIKNVLHVEARIQSATTPSCGHARVFYSFGFSSTADNPVWKTLDMNKKQGTTDTYEADIPLPSAASPPLSYYGEATDCFTDATAGVYNNIVTQNRAPTQKDYTLASWPENISNYAGEINHLGFPYLEETLSRDGMSPLHPDVDIRALRLKQAVLNGVDTLFIELQVAGKISAGGTEISPGIIDYSRSHVYAVLIQNGDRPDDTSTPAPEGLFAILYFLDFGGSGTFFNTLFVDLEAQFNGTTQQAPSSVSSREAGDTSLRFAVPLSYFDGTQNPSSLFVLGATGEYQRIFTQRGFCYTLIFCQPESSWFNSFTLNQDATNTVRFQTQNMQGWP